MEYSDVVNRSPSGAGHLNKIKILRRNWVRLQYAKVTHVQFCGFYDHRNLPR